MPGGGEGASLDLLPGLSCWFPAKGGVAKKRERPALISDGRFLIPKFSIRNFWKGHKCIAGEKRPLHIPQAADKMKTA